MVRNNPKIKVTIMLLFPLKLFNIKAIFHIFKFSNKISVF